MESNTNVIDLLTQQIELISQQNELISQQNELFQINNTCLIIIIFMILIYWLCKAYMLFFKATIL